MLFVIIFFGMFFGLIIFVFTLIASKKKGKFYLAPIVTFLTCLGVTAYGLIKVGGFEGMAYGILGAGILIIAVIGTVVLPFIVNKIGDKQWNKKDKGILVIAPVILFATIGLVLYTDDNYWVVDEGFTSSENQSFESYYKVSTISEGKKQIHINLGKAFTGKEVEVENVDTIGSTEITLEIVDGGESNHIPYIQIGVDQIVEPLKVQTTEGEVIDSYN
ncbi:YesK-like family protein [Gracilibacillus salinarum]|uniref:YesK-like family protein n=1 Tax=Gracilibacillus salinarum TaxID=2932255 RepID=A0ABY4GH00_9BACI|nr:YesK-like family protein [Gracilibacillus salinarum]UOQ83532.1 YesK-like family protein [Gracilibacillus salinarum]